MEYLHTMVRVKNLDESLDFYCNKLGLVEVRRIEVKSAKYTLVFLSAPVNLESAKENGTPTIELTYNWPDENGEVEEYKMGRNFGHLAFRVENIYETCESLKNSGIVINRPPRDGYMAFIKSPDGIAIEFLQKDKALDPIEPWVSMKNSGQW